jgi:DNA-binding GntR family transcriptional regulator
MTEDLQSIIKSLDREAGCVRAEEQYSDAEEAIEDELEQHDMTVDALLAGDVAAIVRVRGLWGLPPFC